MDPHNITQDNLAEFLIGYRDAAHDTGTQQDMSEDADGMDIDWIGGDQTADDLPAIVAAQIMAEALETFATLYDDHGYTLSRYAAQRHQQSAESDGWEATGYDAYLSAAGHGTGLWDRGIPEGDHLHNITQRTPRTLTRDTATGTYYYE